MGYRNNIGFISKRDYRIIKSLTPTGICEYFKVAADQMTISDVLKLVTELYDLGKNVELDTKGKTSNFFKNSVTRDFMGEDGELYLVDKEFFEYIIEMYHNKILRYYNEMGEPFHDSDLLKSVVGDTDMETYKDNYTFDFNKITQEESNALFHMINHIRTFRNEWRLRTPYDLENGDKITKSSMYEYAIYELIRLYKTFNWKKNLLVYYGG